MNYQFREIEVLLSKILYLIGQEKRRYPIFSEELLYKKIRTTVTQVRAESEFALDGISKKELIQIRDKQNV